MPMAIEYIIDKMDDDPLKAWSVQDLVKDIPLPRATISSAVNLASKQPVSPIERVGHGKYRLKLSDLLPSVIDSDPMFTYKVYVEGGSGPNVWSRDFTVQARNAVEAGILGNCQMRRERSDFHISMIEQID